jgi:ferredoxin/flavodoxin---NADP+ reductase
VKVLRAAIVGAGPAGFYAADQLLELGFEVDLYDALPTPFGLVRAGVAPDHPKIKSVARVYAKTAEHEAFRFFGGVELGVDVMRTELLERYHAVLYAIGAAADKRLGIPGEDRPGSHSATEFVAWYNGHPDFADREFALGDRTAVVIGNGNVALDVARMLMLDPDELAATDVADHALGALRRSKIEEVVLLGRRGPAEAAFTNPELRELGELGRADVIVDRAHFDEHVELPDATRRRNVEILREYAARAPQGKSHRIELRFLRSPVEIVGDGEHGAVTGLRVAVNELVTGEDGRPRAVPTGREEVIECGLVLRSIGYRGRHIPGIAFDHDRGVIRNRGGRVCDEDDLPCGGEYVVGWIKRGPTGVIGTNKKDAAETVACVKEDLAVGLLNEPSCDDSAAILSWLAQRAPGAVTWQGWKAIDVHEVREGQPLGRPRVKLVDVDSMRAIAGSSRCGVCSALQYMSLKMR